MPKETETFSPVELMRSVFASADAADIDSIMSFVNFDSVWDVSSWGFGVYEGRRRVRRFLEDWIGSFEEYQRTTEEIVDLGNGVVYAASVTRGRSPGSLDLRLHGATVALWVEGVATRVTFYRDLAEARAAAERLAGSRG